MPATRQQKASKNTPLAATCDWCGKRIDSEEWGYLAGIATDKGEWTTNHFLCLSCMVTAHNALELGRQVTQIVQKGGKQLYIAIERIGQKRELVSVKRWSPLEPLESADSVAQSLHTYQLPQV